MQQNSQSWSKVCFLHSGDAYFESIERMISQAQNEILLESYIFEFDELTEGLLHRLAEFKRRGGRVQILVDGFGSYFWLDTLQKFCQEHQLDFRVYRPLPGSAKLFRRFWIGFFLRFFFLLRWFNRRNHRKTLVIDQRTAFLGSFNWTQVHCQKWMGEKAWRDSGVQLEGPGVPSIALAFQHTWARAQIQRLRSWRSVTNTAKTLRSWKVRNEAAHFPLRINTRRRDRLRLSKQLIKKFNQAQKRIWIASAYFLPKRSYLRALKKAARRGVDVQILWPGPTDVPVVKWAAHPILMSLIAVGAQIHEYQPRVFHAKYLIVDDWAALGSTNFNHRSYFHDLEIEAEFEEPEHVVDLMNQWKKDIENSRLIRSRDLENLPLRQKIISAIAYRLRYLL